MALPPGFAGAARPSTTAHQLDGLAPTLGEQLSQLLQRVEVMDAKLNTLLDARKIKEWYTPAEFAEHVGRTETTAREWCWQGRLQAEKRKSGRGAHRGWAISHDELLRYQKEGLLPIKRPG
jgi:hypothetical protein